MKHINKMILILSAICLVCVMTASAGASSGSNNGYILGDADSSGSVDVRDAATIQKYVVRISSLDTKQQKAADVDQNNRVNIHDATLIQKYISGTNRNYKIGELFTEPGQQSTTSKYELPFIPV